MEAELQHEEVMTEDSLSNDEYECASPDDISLPPLAETPESIALQSDIEENFCFSSHSVHISQYSHQSQTLPEHSDPAAVKQPRESSNTERSPTPRTCIHSSTRSESQHINSQIRVSLCSSISTDTFVRSSKVDTLCEAVAAHAAFSK